MIDTSSNIKWRHLHHAVARESEIISTIVLVYRRTSEISGLAEKLAESDIDLQQLVQSEDVANYFLI